jgi:acetoin utilization deacetylase AcuC-like enzyme
VEDAVAEAPPEFVVLSLGCDALAGDPLGGLALEPVDYHRLTLELRARADDLCGGRLVSLLEGGYAPARMGAAVVQHLRGLAGLPSDAVG